MKDNLRIWKFGCVLASVGILAGGWFLGAQPLLAQADASQAAIASAQSEQSSLQTQLVTLKKKADGIAAIKAKAATAARAVPSGLDAKAFIARLNVLAKRHGLDVQTVQPGAAQAYTAPASLAVAAVPATAATPAPSATPTPSATATADAGPAVPVVVPQAVADPRINAANLVVIPMSVSVSGSPSQILAFSHDVQHDSRLFLVNGFTLSIGIGGTATTGTLAGFIYALKSTS